MDYKHFIPSTLVEIGPRIFQGDCRVAFVCHKNLAKLLEELERNSELAINWLEDNYMGLNTDKSNLLIFGHKQEHQWAQISKDMVWQENTVKFLGKTIDN